MRIFGEKRKPLSGNHERLAGGIARRILALQLRAAVHLNSRTAKVSAQRWLVILVMFCLLFGGYCLYLLIGGLFS